VQLDLKKALEITKEIGKTLPIATIDADSRVNENFITEITIMKIAALDLGSNSFLCLICECTVKENLDSPSSYPLYEINQLFY
jgi:hypothetical protein